MEANSTHISFETAKLLKDCGVESGKVFINTIEREPNDGWKILESINGVGEYPAYTWQEILWEYPVLFFGNEEGSEYYKSINILQKLQDKEYNEADQYFRDNCILIK
jgi:hypothetical protein